MSENETQGSGESGLKILGIPTEKISKLSYMLILASTGFALLLNFLGILGITLPGSVFFGSIGLLSVFLSLVGLFVFEERFTDTDKSHFKFVALAYVSFFAIAMVVGGILKFLGSFGYLVVFAFYMVQFLTFYAGHGLHKDDKPADKDNLNAKYEAYKGVIFNKFKKAEEKAAETVNKVEESAVEPSSTEKTANTDQKPTKTESIDTSA